MDGQFLSKLDYVKNFDLLTYKPIEARLGSAQFCLSKQFLPAVIYQYSLVLVKSNYVMKFFSLQVYI